MYWFTFSEKPKDSEIKHCVLRKFLDKTFTCRLQPLCFWNSAIVKTLAIILIRIVTFHLSCLNIKTKLRRVNITSCPYLALTPLNGLSLAVLQLTFLWFYYPSTTDSKIYKPVPDLFQLSSEAKVLPTLPAQIFLPQTADWWCQCQISLGMYISTPQLPLKATTFKLISHVLHNFWISNLKIKFSAFTVPHTVSKLYFRIQCSEYTK